MAKNVTMKEIADAMGISIVSVSKALSDKEGVGEELRELIKEKASELGYVYKGGATNKPERFNDTHNKIGVLVASRYLDKDAFYTGMYENVLKETAKNNDVCFMESLTDDGERDLRLPDMVVTNSVDGIIVLGQVSADYLEALKNCTVPYIFLDFYDARFDVDGVVSDSVYGGYLLTTHIIESGYKKIAFVGSVMATSSICDRYLGYYKALLENRIDIREDWIIPDRDDEGKYIDLILPKDMPDAFVCNCDAVAYRLIRELKKQGYCLPDDIAVAGYDDFLYSTMCKPQLTTIRVDMQAMSHEAYKLIKNKIMKPNQKIGRKVVGGKLIIRESVKKKYE